MSPEELIKELQKAKYNSITPKLWLGGGVGMFIYFIVKPISGFEWWGGDVIGIILLVLLPGIIFIGGWLEDNF